VLPDEETGGQDPRTKPVQQNLAYKREEKNITRVFRIGIQLWTA
jgi:hypothetical protein